MTEQRKIFRTGDGSLTVCHEQHGELYHSEDGALLEARDLYIERSGIRRCLGPSSDSDSNNFALGKTQVLDVGLGLGYNAMATFEAWLESGASSHLNLTSLEIDAGLVAELASGAAPWQSGWAEEWLAAVKQLAPMADGGWQVTIRQNSGGIFTWRILVGDASDKLFFKQSSAGISGIDFVWQDPFSPEKNPAMWGSEWFESLKSIAKPGTILMTYSVARPVREALTRAGWSVEKISTTTRKKNWLKAKFDGFHLAQAMEPT